MHIYIYTYIIYIYHCISLHEKDNFRLTKICEKDIKDLFFVSFRMYPFHGSIIYSELSFKRK